ncbi:MAG TPA: glycoside hydrolase family 18 protein [Flavitalea sp.]|nr:glycoside hydrolase family 18 protein [Flavitalea sp.]
MKNAFALLVVTIACTYFIACLPTAEQPVNANNEKPVIVAYVGGFRGNLTENVNPMKLSHINYAFVNVQGNRAFLSNEKTDTVNFRLLNDLKKTNKDLKIMISLGGWTWSKNFSDAVLSDTSNRNFSQSAVDIVAKHDLDGIDIDWEYPGMTGDSNIYRPEDKQNYTILFKNMRELLDSLGKVTGKKYFVTTAVGGNVDYVSTTEMDKVAQYCDFINIMAYDFAGGNDTLSNHHTGLYPSSPEHPKFASTDEAVKMFRNAGVPANKLVVGMGFYGKGWEMETDKNNGLFQRTKKPAKAGGFGFIKDSLENKNGFVKYWDDVAKSPYIFNKEKKVFISYDDERSIKEKTDYIKKNKLGGAMFWEYEDDPKENLLTVLAKEFGYVK